MDHPEFVPSFESRCADALEDLLLADADLMGYLEGGVEGIELEDLRLAGDIRTPSLWLFIGPSQEDRLASGSADHQVSIGLLLLTHHPETRGTGGWLRSRVLNHIKRIVRRSDGGVLYEGGTQLTDAVTAFERLESGRLPGAPGVVVSPMTITFRAEVDELTGGPL